jgi:hypothetical protein
MLRAIAFTRHDLDGGLQESHTFERESIEGKSIQAAETESDADRSASERIPCARALIPLPTSSAAAAFKN